MGLLISSADMKLIVATSVLIAGVAGVSCSDRRSETPTLGLATLGQPSGGPEYALGCHSDATAALRVECFDVSGTTEDVYCVTVSANEPTDENVFLDTEKRAQGVQIGQTSGGELFVLVVTTDFGSDTSEIVRFSDTDSDGLPDQGSRVTIVTLNNVHLVSAALDGSSGTLYVADPLNERVLRLGDSDGDLVPDAGAQSVFVEVGGVLGDYVIPRRVEDAQEHSVWLVRPDVIERGQSQTDVIRLIDANQDGIADSTEELGAQIQAEITGWPGAGESAITVEADGTGAYEIQVVGTAEVLATFNGQNGHEQDIGLSRSLVADETIRLFDVDAQEERDFAVVLDPSEPTFFFVANSPEPTEGGDMVFRGYGIQGTEQVEAILGSSTEDNWSACQVTDSDTETLTITVPSLSLTESDSVLFRIKNGVGTVIFHCVVLVDPDE